MIESPAFYPSLTGAQNLRMFATVGCHDPASIPSLLEEVGLDGRGDDRYRSYSLGMKQRLGIAAALLGDPELMILDEPANGLDPQGVREMRTLIAGLAGSGRTVLVSSHDLSELEQVCDWLVLIDTGRSIYQGPTREFLDAAVGGLSIAPQYPEQCDELAAVLLARGFRIQGDADHLLIAVDGPPDELAADVNRAAFDAGIVLVELAVQRTTLEDRYLSLVGGGR